MRSAILSVLSPCKIAERISLCKRRMSAGASCRFSKAIWEKGGWVFRRGQGRIAFAAHHGIAQRIPAHSQLIGALGLFLPVFALLVPVYGNTVRLENAKVQGAGRWKAARAESPRPRLRSDRPAARRSRCSRPWQRQSAPDDPDSSSRRDVHHYGHRIKLPLPVWQGIFLRKKRLRKEAFSAGVFRKIVSEPMSFRLIRLRPTP